MDAFDRCWGPFPLQVLWQKLLDTLRRDERCRERRERAEDALGKASAGRLWVGLEAIASMYHHIDQVFLKCGHAIGGTARVM